MNEYLYPTVPGWIEGTDGLIDSWQKSGKPKCCFPFLWFRPTTLPKNQLGGFWIYFYYSETKTKEVELRGVVKFRIHVIDCDDVPFESDDTHQYADTDAKVWFLCDRFEELRKEDATWLTGNYFLHREEQKQLFSAIRNSIAPVKCTTNFVSVTQCHEITT